MEKIKLISINKLGDGFQMIYTKESDLQRSIYVLEEDFFDNRYWNSGDEYLKLTLSNNGYICQSFIVKGSSNDYQDAIDQVVDFAIGNEIPIDYCIFNDLNENDGSISNSNSSMQVCFPMSGIRFHLWYQDHYLRFYEQNLLLFLQKQYVFSSCPGLSVLAPTLLFF